MLRTRTYGSVLLRLHETRSQHACVRGRDRVLHVGRVRDLCAQSARARAPAHPRLATGERCPKRLRQHAESRAYQRRHVEGGGKSNRGADIGVMDLHCGRAGPRPRAGRRRARRRGGCTPVLRSPPRPRGARETRSAALPRRRVVPIGVHKSCTSGSRSPSRPPRRPTPQSASPTSTCCARASKPPAHRSSTTTARSQACGASTPPIRSAIASSSSLAGPADTS